MAEIEISCGPQLPGPCSAYSAVDAAGLSLAAVNPHPAAQYSPQPPWPPGLSYHAQCRSGPCVDACCSTDPGTGFCLDNLVSQGGFYHPSELLGRPCNLWKLPLGAINAHPQR